MILRSNLPKIVHHALSSKTVLDVGGWWCPLNVATHVIDIQPYETRRAHEALAPEYPERFSAETWTFHDVCVPPWPYPDKFFDFSFCSHLLEDVDDPAAVCKELIRVSKSGYIETPSKLRETFCKDRYFPIKRFLGLSYTIGFDHHKWFCELNDNHWAFTPKKIDGRDKFVTRSDIGRKLTEEESGIYLFWNDYFSFSIS